MNPLAPYLGWIGVWGGEGEAQTGDPTIVRTEFSLVQGGTALSMHFEACDPGYRILYHGVRAILSQAPNGDLRGIAYSTIHRGYLIELTPDDEGVMALTGATRGGNRIFVTFVQEDADNLLFTASWRPNTSAPAGDDTPRMSAPLRRLFPMKFERPPGPPAMPPATQ